MMCDSYVLWTIMSSTGITIWGILLTDAIGLKIRQLIPSCNTGPPIENECPVEPVGVETTIPSILCFISSPINFIETSGVLVRLTLVISMSLRAGGNNFLLTQALSLIRES